MRKLIEYTPSSVDGVFAGAVISAFAKYRDEAHLRDGLDQAFLWDALLMGSTTYERFVKIFPVGTDPWADQINTMPKNVFSLALEPAAWNNTAIVRGNVAAEVTRLKQQKGHDLLIYGHGLLGATLLKHRLLDARELAI